MVSESLLPRGLSLYSLQRSQGLPGSTQMESEETMTWVTVAIVGWILAMTLLVLLLKGGAEGRDREVK